MRSRGRTLPFRRRPLFPFLGAFTLALAVGAVGQEAEPPDDDDEEEHAAVRFEVGSVEAHPGEVVDVPVNVTTEAGLSLAVFSIEYETRAVALESTSLSTDVQAILDANPDADSQFIWFFDPTAGWVQVSLVMDFLARETITIPPGAVVPVTTLKFAVSSDALPGDYEVPFTLPETADYEGELHDAAENPVYQKARHHGTEIDDENELEDSEEDDEIEFESGVITVSIIGDVSVFARGDANVDYQINISDPVRILNMLFLGGESMLCQDAADANDDGEMDLSDAVSILLYLFVGTSSVPLSTEPARDTTPDRLGCAYY